MLPIPELKERLEDLLKDYGVEVGAVSIGMRAGRIVGIIITPALDVEKGTGKEV